MLTTFDSFIGLVWTQSNTKLHNTILQVFYDVLDRIYGQFSCTELLQKAEYQSNSGILSDFRNPVLYSSTSFPRVEKITNLELFVRSSCCCNSVNRLKFERRFVIGKNRDGQTGTVSDTQTVGRIVTYINLKGFISTRKKSSGLKDQLLRKSLMSRSAVKEITISNNARRYVRKPRTINTITVLTTRIQEEQHNQGFRSWRIYLLSTVRMNRKF